MADEAVTAALPLHPNPTIERDPATTGDNDVEAKEDVTMADASPVTSGGTLHVLFTRFSQNVLTAQDAKLSSDSLQRQPADDTKVIVESTADASTANGPVTNRILCFA
jgi:hypothetical protein